jgi:peptidoglycan hydrolase-like protein with peptidoglycan-binding domain
MSRPLIKIKSRGDDVLYAQQRLVRHGHSVDVDGIFGSATQAAVQQFQASRNLTPVDGIVGPDTWGELEAEGEGSADTPTEKPSSEKEILLQKIPADASPEVRSVLERAIDDLGKSEDGSSNWSPEIAHLVDGYNEYWKTGSSSHYPWCAMACSTWIGLGLGLGTRSVDMKWKEHPFKKYYGGAAQIEDWGKAQGQWVEASLQAPAGACFTMARGSSGSDSSSSATAGHVGIVICDNGDGTLTSIEGNVSNSVKTYRRKKSDLRGYTTWA